MAGDWIKMRSELQTHPKVVRILSATKADKFRVVGGLHAVWAVFDTHSVNGILFGYTPETLDHVIGWDGFSRAMIAVGWLQFDGAETLTLPEFEEHNGQSAKRRAEDQKRKRNGRKEDTSPDDVRNESGQDADKKRTREDKREDINKAGRASRLPADWTPSESDIAFCRSERPDLNTADIADQFRDYWIAQAGAKGRKVDWSATWRNWVRNQRQSGRMNGHGASDSIFG